MRCKVGDIAFIVRADNDPQHLHKIVTCIHWENDRWGGAWNTYPRLKDSEGRIIGWHDDDLQPIRDQPGADETLQWAPVPATTKRLTEEESKTAEAAWSKA